MIIAKHFEFESAHKLIDAGNCSNLHGHTYKLTIEIEGEISAKGWVMNFKDFKNIVMEKVVNILDHSYLNDILDSPTAENLILWIKEQLHELPLKSIILYETSDSYAKIEC